MKAMLTTKELSDAGVTRVVMPEESQQQEVGVRSRIMLMAYAKVVNSIAHLNDEERRRVMKAANITCGEAP